MPKTDQNQRKSKLWKGFENIKEKLFFCLVLVIAVVLPAHGLLSLAEESAAAPIATAGSDNQGSANNVITNSNTAIPFPDYDKDNSLRATKSSRFLDRIKTEISSSEDDLMKINEHISTTKDKIVDTEKKLVTLQDQLNNLNERIKNAQEMIDNVLQQIKKKQSEVETLQYQMAQEKIAISFQKQTLAEYLKVIFKDREKFTNMQDDSAQLNTLKLLLSDQSTADDLRSLRYSEILEEEGRKIFEKLDVMLDQQKTDQQLLELKQRTLTLLFGKLNDEKVELEADKQAKSSLLEQTKGEQSVYQQLLDKTKAEQEDVLSQVDTLRKNMLFVQERMKTLGDQFNPDDYVSLLNIGNSKNLMNYLNGSEGDGAEFNPRWPVNPARGISAYFRDTAYASIFHMQHNAVDIPTPQSTPIHAPADGFVYKAKDNGYGYSYIMLAHRNGFMTLYGHVSSILVTEGDEIQAGDIIGLSGAMPGSKGAGAYTTGPHLHFEVLKNGEHVDPLSYLNLAYLRFDSLPEKYVVKALGDRKKVRRAPAKVKVKQENAFNLQNEATVLPLTIDDGRPLLFDLNESTSTAS